MADLAAKMKITDVFIEEEIKSGALGAGVDIFKSKGVMVVDIGGGTTDVGIISFGDIVLSRTIRKAGSFMDDEISKYVKKTQSVEIGELTAEKMKIELGDLHVDRKKRRESVCRKRHGEGNSQVGHAFKPRKSQTVLTPVFDEIVKLITGVLKDTPPELSADIYKHGILLTGGCAMIRGIEEYIKERIQVPVKVVQNPLTLCCRRY